MKFPTLFTYKQNIYYTTSGILPCRLSKYSGNNGRPAVQPAAKFIVHAKLAVAFIGDSLGIEPTVLAFKGIL